MGILYNRLKTWVSAITSLANVGFESSLWAYSVVSKKEEGRVAQCRRGGFGKLVVGVVRSVEEARGKGVRSQLAI